MDARPRLCRTSLQLIYSHDAISDGNHRVLDCFYLDTPISAQANRHAKFHGVGYGLRVEHH